MKTEIPIKKRVKFLDSVAIRHDSFQATKEYDLDEADCTMFINAGLAVEVKAEVEAPAVKVQKPTKKESK
jgi:hypothetical protein